MNTKTKDYVKLVEEELKKRGLDMEVDMWNCGNLNMVCQTVYESLIASDSGKAVKGFPNCVNVYSK